MGYPLVSVIIPVYNSELFIEETLFSILAQRSVDLEIIVVDDCSSDQSVMRVSKIAKYDQRVKLFKLDFNNGGPAAPRNYGINRANGTWIAFCDSDDLWHPYKLRTQLDAAFVSGANFVCSQVKDFSAGNPLTNLQPQQFNCPRVQFISYATNFLKNKIATSSVLCKKEILFEQRFNENDNFVAVEDYDLWLRLLEKRDNIVIKVLSQLVFYRRVNNSISSKKILHSKKVMYVLYCSSLRNDRGLLFLLLLPLIFAYYVIVSIYLRIICGKL